MELTATYLFARYWGLS